MGPTWLLGAMCPAAAPPFPPAHRGWGGGGRKFNNFTVGKSSAELAEAFHGINPASPAARRSHGC